MNDFDKKVLIAEDDECIALLLGDVLKKEGYKPDLAEDGAVAFELFKQYRYQVVITDLEMPKMDGNTLIDKIKALEPLTVIIIISAHSESQLIISSMKQGVYDYIVKPIDIHNYQFMVKRAFDYAKLCRAEDNIEKQKKIKLEQQLDWYRWEEKIKQKQFNIKDSTLFTGLKEGFSQGAGVGALITILELIVANGEKRGDEFCVDASLIELASDNLQFAKKGLDIFSEIDSLERNELSKEVYTLDQVFNLIKNQLAELKSFVKLKNNKFLMSSKKSSFSEKTILINQKYFKKVISEIIKNALKFSVHQSEVTVILEIKDDKFVINVLNKPIKNENATIGIPPEYENLVFEPFFRINKILNENYETLEFGIGLTLCEKVIKKHNGQIRLYNITDYSNIKEEPATKVCCEIHFNIK